MGLFFSFLMAAYSSPSQLSVFLDESLQRSKGKAYIIRSFVVDNIEYELDPNLNQMVDSIYWFPSGRIRVQLKEGSKSIDLGFSTPLANKTGQTATYYFPADFEVIQRDLVEEENISSDGLAFRNLRSKLVIQTPKDGPIFIESERPQVYINNMWVTP